jgi:hypothetical protein
MDNLNLNKEQASALFDKFVENDLIWDFNDPNNYRIGVTLTVYANIVNDSDMNIEKWLEKNGQSMTEDELKKELKNY